MDKRSFNVGEAKNNLSKLLGRVAYGKESLVITRRGCPIARLVPIDDEEEAHLGDAEGWLDEDDPFFSSMDEIISSRDGEQARHLSIDEDEN